MQNNLKSLRNRAGLTMEDAAQRIGISRKGYEKIERGERRLTAKYIEAAARAFGVAQIEVIGSSPPIPVIGRIGPGGEVLPCATMVPDEGLYKVELEFPLPEGMAAFEVHGDCLYPRYGAGDVLVFPIAGTPMADFRNGDEAAILTDAGVRLVKHVFREGAGSFRLESHNAPPISGVKLQWVARILCNSRVGQYRTIEKSKSRSEKKEFTNRGLHA